MRLALLVALLLAGCAAGPSADTANAGPGTGTATGTGTGTWAWRETGEAPIILAETAVATEGSMTYIVGGWTEAGGGSPLALSYDAEADAWAQLPPYPVAVHHAQAAAIEGTLYVFGGAATQALLPGTLTGVGPAGWPITPLAFKLSPGAPAWEPIAQLPEARGLGGAAVVEGRIYLIGGVALGGTYLDQVDVYDPASDGYAHAAPLPTTRDHLSVVAMDGRVYAIAGRSNANGTWDDIEAAEALDVANDTWIPLAPAPLGRGGQGAAILAGGLVALVGGERAEGEFTVYDAAHAYDPSSDAWIDLPPLPEPRHGMPTSWHDGRMLLFGGATETAILRSTLTLEQS